MERMLAPGLHHHAPAAALAHRPSIRGVAVPSTSGRPACPAQRPGARLIVAVSQLERAAEELERQSGTSGEVEAGPATTEATTSTADQSQKKKRRSRRFKAMASQTPGTRPPAALAHKRWPAVLALRASLT